MLRGRLLETWLDLIRIPSVTGNEWEIADYITEILREMDIEPQRILYGPEESPSLVARLKGTRPGPRLLLAGHLDTVVPAQGWRTNPFEPAVEGDRVWGLGSCDMKGGVAAIIETLLRIKEAKVELAGELIIALAADEEYLSRGTWALLEEGLQADMAIMAECRFEQAALGFRGRYSILVEVKGESAHASRYPLVGRSAIMGACLLAHSIEALPTVNHPGMGGGTWCIRHIEGGTRQTLSVPESCTLFVDRYVVPGETFASCREQILGAATDLGLEVEISLSPRTTPYMEAFSLSQDHPLVSCLAREFENVTGNSLELGYDPSVCDSNYLASRGIPTITFGPGGANLHQANEYGLISQVQQAAEIYYQVCLKILRG